MRLRGGSRTPADLPALPDGVARLVTITTPLQAVFSESLDLSNIPDDWLPMRLGTNVVARQAARTLQAAARADDTTVPLVVITEAAEDVQYWHQSGAAWTMEETIDIGSPDETDVEARVEEEDEHE